MAQARARLGAESAGVQWIAADITTWQPARRNVVWHDRAVFHFLVDVQRYSAEALHAVLGSTFRLMRSQFEEHVTPAGNRQQFLYSWWRSEG